jgi:hypothetical protein
MEKSGSLEVALKEWDAVCSALAAGRQIMLLRKGGIHEEAGEFQLEHRRFLLFPTFLHQERRLLKPEVQHLVSPVAAEPSRLTLALFAEAVDILPVRNLAPLSQMEHVWADELLRMRWDYRPENPLYVLTLRVFRLPQPVSIANTPAYAGCRSWVKLDGPIALEGAAPVMADEAFESRRRVLIDGLR